jgi:hypothetical protein
MTRSKLIGATVVAAALVLTACGSDDGDATETTTTTVETATGQESGAGTTVTTSADESEGAEVVEQLEPPGEVTGGTVGRSYPADSYPPELGGIIGMAITDLATSLGVDEGAVTVVLVEEVVWADASLGCPQPGMAYAQVITDGMRIILQAEQTLFDYRSGGATEPFRCVQAVITEKSTSGLLEIQEDGSVIIVVPPSKDGGLPTEGNNPPDE